MDSLLINYEEKISKVGQKISMALQPYENDDGIKGHAEHIREIYQEKLKDVRPKLMVYGIYNAGKSSIINELLGADKAEVEDVPKTDKVTGYEWNGYTLYDTPGVGAPIEHENVTNEHLKDADIVMFVMSTTGSSEKAENYIRMKDIADAGKKIIIVLNDKNGDLGVHDDIIQEIKIHVSEHMKQVGIAEVEKKYCIVVVNAMRAKKGKEKNNPALWEKSNMEELRQVLLSELKKTSSFQVMRRLVGQMQQELLAIITALGEEERQEEIRKLEKVLQILQKERADLRERMQSFIQIKCSRFGTNLAECIWQNLDNKTNREVAAQELHQKLIDDIQKKLQNEAEEMKQGLDISLQQLIKEETVVMANLDAGKISVSKLMPDVSKLQGDDLSENFFTDGILPFLNDMKKQELPFIDEYIRAICKLAKVPFDKLQEKAWKSDLPRIAPTIFTPPEFKKIPGGSSKPSTDLLLAKWMMNLLIERASDIYDQMREYLDDEEDGYNKAEKRAAIKAQIRQELQQKSQYAADELADRLIAKVNDVIQNIFQQIEAPIQIKTQREKDDESQRIHLIMKLRYLAECCDNLCIELGKSAKG